jgi:transcriptional regulator with XRE-family HTH domain/archaellum component FlaF (FlaF/FlaG flagellin family)
MFDKLAEELKEARIKNNLTLKQLAAKTRIDLKFLEAMEEGNFSFLPELYVKAFVKEYANVTGLDPEITLKKYEAAKEGLPYQETSGGQSENHSETDAEEENTKDGTTEKAEDKAKDDSREEQAPKFREVKHSAHQSGAIYSKPPVFDSTPPKRADQPQNKNNIIIGAAVGALIILFGIIYLLFFNNSDEIVVPEKPYDEVVTESRQRYEEVPSSTADSSVKNGMTVDSLNLTIQTTDTSWVRVILDNTREEEFIMFPNSQKSIKAEDSYKITFGRSSAIRLQLNNRPLSFNPGSRNVTYVKIDSKGLEFLKKPPETGQEQ